MIRHALRKSQTVRTTKVEHDSARVLCALVAQGSEQRYW